MTSEITWHKIKRYASIRFADLLFKCSPNIIAKYVFSRATPKHIYFTVLKVRYAAVNKARWKSIRQHIEGSVEVHVRDRAHYNGRLSVSLFYLYRVFSDCRLPPWLLYQAVEINAVFWRSESLIGSFPLGQIVKTWLCTSCVWYWPAIFGILCQIADNFDRK